MVNVYFQPPPSQFPLKGGVATHLKQLHKYLSQQVSLVDHPDEADLLHVESSWPIPKTIREKPVVYVCHGGFIPQPIPTVVQNLHLATKIISVAKWLVQQYFPQYRGKTVVIPNGIELVKNVPDSPYGKDYFLYGKEWEYYFDDFNFLVTLSSHRFISTIWLGGEVPSNLNYIGLQSFETMQSIIKNAAALIITGSEVCPTMLLEAWALKVPVLARNIDGSKELMRPENEVLGGFLYNTKNELLVALDWALLNRNKLGNQGYQEVVQKYQWKNLVSKYVEVYQECL